MAKVAGLQKDGSYVPCPECKYVPPPYTGPGTPIRQEGTIHLAECPTIPKPTEEERERLREDLRKITEAQRRAWAESRNIWIG